MRHQPAFLGPCRERESVPVGLGFGTNRKQTGQCSLLGRLKTMTKLVFSDFDEYDQALRGVSDHEPYSAITPATRLEFARH